jgi:photosystem II stability/assembly factor-like uncharacterized protein
MKAPTFPLHRLLPLVALLVAACGDGPPAGPVDPPGPPASMTALENFPPRGTTGEPVSVPPAVRVRDGRGRVVPGVTVTFTVQSGGGSVANATAVTDAGGVARAGAWTLGPALGEQTLVARAGSLNAVLRTTAEWKLTPVPAPENALLGLFFHPQDDRTWYALGATTGLHLSTDAGATWTLAFAGRTLNQNALVFDPRAQDTLFLGHWNRLMVSGDRGKTWTERSVFPEGIYIRSVLAGRDGALLVAPQWPAGKTPGIYRSQDRGRTWTHHPFGVQEGLQILTWDLEEDPETGLIWAGNEIADHPRPYRPPFLMSGDGGRTWQDVTARLPWLYPEQPWHIIDIERAGPALLALAEGPGLFRSTDGGATWAYVTRDFGLELGVDHRRPERVFGGDFGNQVGGGGVWVSLDGGRSFFQAATVASSTSALNVSGLAFSADGTRLYVASYGGGIMMATLPAP